MRQPIGPVFVSGRQHGGNTLVTLILSRVAGCFAIQEEGIFFEHRRRLDRLPDPQGRAQWIASHLKLDDPTQTDQAIEYLSTYAAQHPDADALALYRRVMDFLTESAGAWFWAQKATSYIFYGRQILAQVPDAKMVYLLRNPFDVSASKKRRQARDERVFGWMLSWNKGLRLALDLAQQHPGRLHLMKYEDLVAHPQPEIQRLCEFVGVDFDPHLLDVPHINPSDAKYQVVAGSQGLNLSRLYYYMHHLSAGEITALNMLADKKLLKRFYPDLPHQHQPRSSGALLSALWLIAKGPFHDAADRVRIARQVGSPLISRTLHRIFGR